MVSRACLLTLGSLFLVWAVAKAQSPGPTNVGEPAAEGKAEGAAQEAAGQQDSRALASFDGGEVTVAELEDVIARQSPFMRKRYKDKEALAELLDKTVRFELLAREAERRGFGERDTVRQAVKQNAVQQLMRTEFDEKLSAESIPDEDVKAYYEEHIDEYVRPATRRASHIMVATLEEAKALQQELQEQKDLDLRAFRKLAREKSIDDTTKLRGGDLRYFDATGRLRGETEPSIPKSIAKATFALDTTGDISPQPVKVEGGYSLVMLTGQRPAVDRKVGDKDVQQSIRVRLWRERRQDAIERFVANLQAQYKPEIQAELLPLIKLDDGPPVARGPGVPENFPTRRPGATQPQAQGEGEDEGETAAEAQGE